MSAEDLGKRLVGEVEEVGLDEVLNALRIHNGEDTSSSHFGLAPLDNLINTTRSTNTKTQPAPHIIELLSPSPASGKTSLLYHLTALAVLPTHLGGKQAAVVILDADNRFSVSRLIQQLKYLTKHHESAEDTLPHALKHIHIFRPQSLPSLVSTVQSLKGYLFNATKHHSFDRHIAFIALDSASTFLHQARSAAEDATLTKSPQPPGYGNLAAALKSASKTLSAPVIFTAWDLGPAQKKTSMYGGMRSFRPPLPPPWQSFATLRLVVRRVAVRKLPVEISLEEGRREGELRQRVVEKGRFECFVNEWGIDEGTRHRLAENGDGGFRFRVVGEGVLFEEDVEVGV